MSEQNMPAMQALYREYVENFEASRILAEILCGVAPTEPMSFEQFEEATWKSACNQSVASILDQRVEAKSPDAILEWMVEQLSSPEFLKSRKKKFEEMRAIRDEMRRAAAEDREEAKRNLGADEYRSYLQQCGCAGCVAEMRKLWYLN